MVRLLFCVWNLLAGISDSPTTFFPSPFRPPTVVPRLPSGRVFLQWMVPRVPLSRPVAPSFLSVYPSSFPTLCWITLAVRSLSLATLHFVFWLINPSLARGSPHRTRLRSLVVFGFASNLPCPPAWSTPPAVSPVGVCGFSCGLSIPMFRRAVLPLRCALLFPFPSYWTGFVPPSALGTVRSYFFAVPQTAPFFLLLVIHLMFF